MKHRGLTLLEVLVTITIFAMLIAVLTAGWQQSLRAQLGLARVAEVAEQHQQIERLLRQTFSEAVAPLPDHGEAFFADPSGIDAESTSPLRADLDRAPTPLHLRLVGAPGGWELTAQDLQTQQTRRWPWRFRHAQLLYLDTAGQAHTQWPPDGKAPDRFGSDQHLPSLIRFDYQLDGESRARSLLFAPMSANWHFPEPSSPFAAANQ